MTFGHPWFLLLALAPLAWGYYEWPKSNRRRALALKVASFVLVFLAIAEPRLDISTSRVAVGMLVDTSASVTQSDLDRASQLASELNSARGRSALRVIPFARATRPAGASEDQRPWKIRPTSGEAGRATDIEAAVREAITSLPAGMLPRLALVSDGLENRGSIARAAWQAQQAGIAIDTFPLQGRSQPAVRLESVSLPPNAFTGEPFSIELALSAPKPVAAEVELAAEGRSLGKSQVSLSAGTTQIRMHASVNTPGALDLSVSIRAEGAGELRFDQAIMLRRPRLLYLSQDSTLVDGNLGNALAAAEFEVVRSQDFGQMKLADFQLVVLNNWDLEKIDPARKGELEQFVKQGGGLLVIGGEHNVYDEKKTAEDALDRVLPAKLLPPRSQEGTVVVLIIDKSSSMDGPKMELAKAAATGAAMNLRPIDQVGVLMFDNSWAWAIPIRKADDRNLIASRIASIFPNGGTQIPPALTEAYQKVLPVTAPYRHILLLTDGISEEGNSYAIAKDAAAQHISISTIGLGADVHREYLEKVAQIAEGKSYFLKDPQGLEQIVLRDVMEHTGSTAVEKTLAPEVAKLTEILEGVDIAKAPPLKGYVRFEAKPTAETILRFDPREPLLMRWQYGLGRSAVFTSDAKNRWAADWVAWKGYDKFWTNLSRDLLPHTQAGEARVEFDSANGDLVVDYRLGPGVEEPAKLPAIYAIGSDGFQKSVPILRTAAGAYHGRLRIGPRQGLFRVRPLEDSPIFPEIGLYRPETELTEYGANPELLKRVAEFTGGHFQPNASAVFDSGGRSLASVLPLWPGLLALALALGVAEIVMRKWNGVFRRT